MIRNLVAVVAVVAAVATTSSLGVWQLRRAEEKAAAQAARDAALAAPPIDLVTVVDAARSHLGGQRVVATGHFDAAATILLDNRTHQGVAGFHVLTPMRLAGSDRTVMVLRGWVARDVRDRARALPYDTPVGAVRIEGLALAELPQPIVLRNEPPDVPSGPRQHFDLVAWRATTGPTALPVIVRQTSTLEDRLVRAWVEPGSGVDRHRGYAFQWFAMSAAILVLALRPWARWRRRPT